MTCLALCSWSLWDPFCPQGPVTSNTGEEDWWILICSFDLCRAPVPHILPLIVHRHPPAMLKWVFENWAHPFSSDAVLYLYMNVPLSQNKKSNEKVADTNILINICWFDLIIPRLLKTNFQHHCLLTIVPLFIGYSGVICSLNFPKSQFLLSCMGGTIILHGKTSVWCSEIPYYPERLRI